MLKLFFLKRISTSKTIVGFDFLLFIDGLMDRL